MKNISVPLLPFFGSPQEQAFFFAGKYYGQDANKQGEANRLARITGLEPEGIVSGDPTTVRRIAELPQIKAILDSDPLVAQWAMDPRNAAVSSSLEDFRRMADLSRKFLPLESPGADKSFFAKYYPRLYGSGLRIAGASNLNLLALGARAVGARETEARLRGRAEELSTKAQEISFLNQGANIVTESILAGAESIPLVASYLTPAAGLRLFQAARVARNPQAAQGFMARFADKIAAGATAVGIGAGVGATAFYEAMEAGKSELEAARFGLTQGGIEAGAEFLPVYRLFKNVSIGNPFLRTVLQNMAEEAVQEGATALAQTLDEALTFRGSQDILPTFGEWLSNAPEAFLSGAIAGASASAVLSSSLYGAYRGGSRLLGIDRMAREAMQAAEFLNDLQKTAAATGILQRDPRSVADFINAAAEESPVENIYIPGQQFSTLLAQNEITPQRLAEIFPSAVEQVETAALSGTDVVIPVGEFVTGIAAVSEDTKTQLLRQSKTQPDAMSVQEAEEYMESKGKQVLAELDKARVALATDAAARKQVEVVSKGIASMLKDADRSEAEARQGALLWSQAFLSLSKTTGVSVENLWNRFKPQIKTKLPDDTEPSSPMTEQATINAELAPSTQVPLADTWQEMPDEDKQVMTTLVFNTMADKLSVALNTPVSLRLTYGLFDQNINFGVEAELPSFDAARVVAEEIGKAFFQDEVFVAASREEALKNGVPAVAVLSGSSIPLQYAQRLFEILRTRYPQDIAGATYVAQSGTFYIYFPYDVTENPLPGDLSSFTASVNSASQLSTAKLIRVSNLLENDPELHTIATDLRKAGTPLEIAASVSYVKVLRAGEDYERGRTTETIPVQGVQDTAGAGEYSPQDTGLGEGRGSVYGVVDSAPTGSAPRGVSGEADIRNVVRNVISDTVDDALKTFLIKATPGADSSEDSRARFVSSVLEGMGGIAAGGLPRPVERDALPEGFPRPEQATALERWVAFTKWADGAAAPFPVPTTLPARDAALMQAVPGWQAWAFGAARTLAQRLQTAGAWAYAGEPEMWLSEAASASGARLKALTGRERAPLGVVVNTLTDDPLAGVEKLGPDGVLITTFRLSPDTPESFARPRRFGVAPGAIERLEARRLAVTGNAPLPGEGRAALADLVETVKKRLAAAGKEPADVGVWLLFSSYDVVTVAVFPQQEAARNIIGELPSTYTVHSTFLTPAPAHLNAKQGNLLPPQPLAMHWVAQFYEEEIRARLDKLQFLYEVASGHEPPYADEERDFKLRRIANDIRNKAKAKFNLTDKQYDELLEIAPVPSPLLATLGGFLGPVTIESQILPERLDRHSDLDASVFVDFIHNMFYPEVVRRDTNGTYIAYGSPIFNFFLKTVLRPNRKGEALNLVSYHTISYIYKNVEAAKRTALKEKDRKTVAKLTAQHSGYHRRDSSENPHVMEIMFIKYPTDHPSGEETVYVSGVLRKVAVKRYAPSPSNKRGMDESKVDLEKVDTREMPIKDRNIIESAIAEMAAKSGEKPILFHQDPLDKAPPLQLFRANFFSALYELVDEYKSNIATVQQWKALVKKATKGELEAVKMDRFFEGKSDNDKVSKQELLTYISNNYPHLILEEEDENNPKSPDVLYEEARNEAIEEYDLDLNDKYDRIVATETIISDGTEQELRAELQNLGWRPSGRYNAFVPKSDDEIVDIIKEYKFMLHIDTEEVSDGFIREALNALSEEEKPYFLLTYDADNNEREAFVFKTKEHRKAFDERLRDEFIVQERDYEWIDERADEILQSKDTEIGRRYINWRCGGECADATDYTETLFILPPGVGGNPTQAGGDSHWPVPGVFMHIRHDWRDMGANHNINRRFVGEIQSTEHTAGMRRGYAQATQEEIDAALDAAANATRAHRDAIVSFAETAAKRIETQSPLFFNDIKDGIQAFLSVLDSFSKNETITGTVLNLGGFELTSIFMSLALRGIITKEEVSAYEAFITLASVMRRNPVSFAEDMFVIHNISTDEMLTAYARGMLKNIIDKQLSNMSLGSAEALRRASSALVALQNSAAPLRPFSQEQIGEVAKLRAEEQDEDAKNTLDLALLVMQFINAALTTNRVPGVPVEHMGEKIKALKASVSFVMNLQSTNIFTVLSTPLGWHDEDSVFELNELNEAIAKIDDLKLREVEADSAYQRLRQGVRDIPWKTPEYARLALKYLMSFGSFAWIRGNQQNGGGSGGEWFYDVVLPNIANEIMKPYRLVKKNASELLPPVVPLERKDFLTGQLTFWDAFPEDAGDIGFRIEYPSGSVYTASHLLSQISRAIKYLSVVYPDINEKNWREYAKDFIRLSEEDILDLELGREDTPSFFALTKEKLGMGVTFFDAGLAVRTALNYARELEKERFSSALPLSENKPVSLYEMQGRSNKDIDPTILDYITAIYAATIANLEANISLLKAMTGNDWPVIERLAKHIREQNNHDDFMAVVEQDEVIMNTPITGSYSDFYYGELRQLVKLLDFARMVETGTLSPEEADLSPSALEVIEKAVKYMNDRTENNRIAFRKLWAYHVGQVLLGARVGNQRYKYGDFKSLLKQKSDLEIKLNALEATRRGGDYAVGRVTMIFNVADAEDGSIEYENYEKFVEGLGDEYIDVYRLFFDFGYYEKLSELYNRAKELNPGLAKLMPEDLPPIGSMELASWLGRVHTALSLSATIYPMLISSDKSENAIKELYEHLGKLVNDTNQQKGPIYNISERINTLSNAGHFTVTPPSQLNRFSMFQKKRGEPLGAYDPSTRTIYLLRGANLSTFLHESAHYFLHVYEDLARENEAAAERFGRLLSFFGVTADEWDKMTWQEKEKYHEIFARGFEAYLFEGNAPRVSAQMASLFSTYASWLRGIYGQASVLGVEPKGELKAFFDMLVASEETVNEFEEIQGLMPLFGEKPKDMNEAEWQEYQKLLSLSQEQAKSEHARKSADIMKWLENARSKAIREAQRAMRNALNAIKDELRPALEQEPVYALQRYLREEGRRIDREEANEVLAFLPDDERTALLARLSRYLTRNRDNTLPLAMLADGAGFPSPVEALRALATAPRLEDELDARAREALASRSPELSEEAQEERVAEALHNRLRGRILALEYATLARLAGKPAALAAAAREYAARQAGASPVGAVYRVRSYLAAVATAGRRAEQALRRGDLEAAAAAKRDQLLAHYMVRASLDAIKEVDDFKRLIKAIINRPDERLAKTRDMDFVNAARAILASYGVDAKKNNPEQYLDRLASIQPERAEELRNIIRAVLGDGSTPLEKLSLDDFRAVASVVKGLWDMSRTEKQMIVRGKRVSLEEAAEAVVAELSAITPPKPIEPDRAPSAADRIIRAFHGIASRMRRVENWTNAIGRNATRYIWEPVSEASDRYRLEKEIMFRRYKELLEGIKHRLAIREIKAPELNYVFATHGELLHALLHYGNESNATKLLVGRKWGAIRQDGTLDTSRWQAFLDRAHREGIITLEDWNFVVSVWQLLEDYKQDAQAAHKEMYGYFFKEIEAWEVDTPFGKFKGGYVPALHDPFLVQDAAVRREAEKLEEQPHNMFPTPARGFTKSRVENYNVPLALDLRLLPRHLDKVLKFIYVAPAVADVSKLLRNPELKEAIFNYDPTAATEMLFPWLQRAVRQTVETPASGDGGHAFDNFCRILRARVGMQLMFFNIINTLQQLTGFSTMLAEVKLKYLRRALVNYIRNPGEAANAAREASILMRNRTDSQSYEIAKVIEQLTTDIGTMKRTQEWFARNAYATQQALQNVMDVIVWHAAFEQAVEQGDSNEDAIAFANGVVRKTQMSVAPEDISSIESGSPFVRMFTQFLNYFNMVQNLLQTEVLKAIRETGLKKKYARLVYLYIVGFAIPAVFGEVIATALRGGPDDDDDDGYTDEWLEVFFVSQVRYALAAAPVAGQFGNAVISNLNNVPYDDRVSLSPAFSALETGAGLSGIVMAIMDPERDVSDRKAVRDILSILGLATGLPLGAAGRPLGYLAGVAEGRIEPTDELDFVRGLISGAPSPESVDR